MENNYQGSTLFRDKAFHFYLCALTLFLLSLKAHHSIIYQSHPMSTTVRFKAFLSKKSGFSKDSTNLALSLTIKRHPLICKRKSKIKIK